MSPPSWLRLRSARGRLWRRGDLPPRLGRRPALDGVRGVAILGVLLAHGQHHGAFPGLVPGGHLGVTVFFALSGFLITTLLLEEYDRHQRIDLPHFYLRRAARLLPALLVLLPFHALVWSFEVSVDTLLLAILPMLLYVSNLVRAQHVIHMAGTTFSWSLAIEEQFYLGWPPVLKRALERGRGLVTPVAVCLAMAAVACGVRIWFADESGWHGWLYFSTVSRVDALAVGCLAAMARWRLRLPWLTLAGWLGLGWLGYAYTRYGADAPPTFAVGFLSTAVAATLVVLAVVARPESRLAGVFANPVLVRLGVLSYGLYLWNLLPFQAWKIFSGSYPGVVGTVACLGIGYGMAELSYRLVEQPVMRWARERMRGTPAPTVRLPERMPPEEMARVHAAQLRVAEARALATLPSVGATIR